MANLEVGRIGRRGLVAGVASVAVLAGIRAPGAKADSAGHKLPRAERAVGYKKATKIGQVMMRNLLPFIAANEDNHNPYISVTIESPAGSDETVTTIDRGYYDGATGAASVDEIHITRPGTVNPPSPVLHAGDTVDVTRRRTNFSGGAPANFEDLKDGVADGNSVGFTLTFGDAGRASGEVVLAPAHYHNVTTAAWRNDYDSAKAFSGELGLMATAVEGIVAGKEMADGSPQLPKGVILTHERRVR
jgi:hypothetical protein